jgi:hypothetical protein
MKNISIVKNVRLVGTLALVSIAILGCGVGNFGSVSYESNCELNLNAVCARIIEAYRGKPSTRTAGVEPARGAQVELLIMPIKMPDGALAAEVDCYTGVTDDGSWLVYAHLAIPPDSQQSVKYLREQELCSKSLPARSLAMGSTLANTEAR